MTKLVRFDAGDGAMILIEVEDVASGDVKPVSKLPGELAAKARKTLSEAIEDVAPMIRTLKQQLNDAIEPADEVEVKFGIKLSGEISAVVTKASSEATYEITLKWKKK